MQERAKNTMELQELEEGYRFHPTDAELLTFLVRFIAKKDMRDNGYITKHDVYKQEPWVTYGYGSHSGGVEANEDTSICRYFITPRHRKKDRFCRIVGKKLGTWKQQDKGKCVLMTSCGDQSKSLFIGRRKSLRYETTKSCPDDRKWLMKEYVLCEAILGKFRNSELEEYAICAIRKRSKKSSPDATQRSNVIMDYSARGKGVASGVNSVEPSMDLEYTAITPIDTVVESVEAEVKIQEPSGEENDGLGITTSSQIQVPHSENAMSENCNDPEIMDMLDRYYEMIGTSNAVEYPMVEFDDLEVQIQGAAGKENGVLGLTNAMPERNLPKEPLLDKNQPQHQPAPLHEGCTFGVNEDHIAYLELEANNTSFVELLSGGDDSAMRNNQVQAQLELNSFSQIQESVIPDFGNLKSEINMPEIFDTLAEYMGVTVLMDLDYELITPFNFSEQAIVESNELQVQIQEAAGEENGLSRLTTFSQIQEFVMPESNVPETFDMGDKTLLEEEKNQKQHQPAPQEESVTLCETEESSLVSDLGEAMLDHATMKDRNCSEFAPKPKTKKKKHEISKRTKLTNAHLPELFKL
ncbi:hypothetical protein HAX54_016497 [Datura stramonium]|uniref:NAC domain-containing protein n=1 Tax=Datura stramonium TaxID=4076 RepID=A0ABS8UJ09_DATST|nr:hypothetical protein [Datura stramonium]